MANTRKTRLRWPNSLPKLPDEVSQPYALSRPELADLGPGEQVKICLDSAAWQRVMVPILDDLDRNRAKRGPRPLYTAHELESVLLLQRLMGFDTCREARDYIASDREAARIVLGLDSPRNAAHTLVKLRDGIPSEATLSRHRARFGEARRLEAYKKLEREGLADHLATPELREEARILHIDGSRILTHYTCPKRDPKTGKVVNEAETTCEDGGFVPHEAGPEKSGNGFNLVTAVTATGVPLAWRVTALNEAETEAALDIFRNDWSRDVEPYLDADKLAVLSADAAYSSASFRAELRKHRIVENIHHVSHGASTRSRDNARAKGAARYRIVGCPNWFANGHRELLCKCGAGKTWRHFDIRKGRAVTRVEGSCPTCGPVMVTSGRWRAVQNPGGFARCHTTDPDERRDWLLGNHLTFNDRLSNVYGNSRFGHNEGFHGALSTRFGLNRRSFVLISARSASVSHCA